jgi:protein-tyrosine phosphatase
VTSALPDIPNFRDAGGLATGFLRPGLVYRSAQLSGISAPAQQSLRDIGIVSAFDLRTADEVRNRPDELPPGVCLTVLDVLADRPHSGAAAVASLVTEHGDRATIEDVNDAVTGGRSHDLMIETYRYLVSLPSAHAGYRSLLQDLGQAEGGAVIHCTAGKDRTGWAIAVLQRFAGASMDDVVADYLASNEPMRQTYGPMLDQFAAAGGDAEALSQMIYVQPDYLDAAITLMHHVYGGLEGYLTTALELSAEDIDALGARLVA